MRSSKKFVFRVSTPKETKDTGVYLPLVGQAVFLSFRPYFNTFFMVKTAHFCSVGHI